MSSQIHISVYGYMDKLSNWQLCKQIGKKNDCEILEIKPVGLFSINVCNICLLTNCPQKQLKTNKLLNFTVSFLVFVCLFVCIFVTELPHLTSPRSSSCCGRSTGVESWRTTKRWFPLLKDITHEAPWVSSIPFNWNKFYYVIKIRSAEKSGKAWKKTFPLCCTLPS